MAVVYSVRNWARHFEVAQSRKVKAMSWVAIANKHDGKSYRRLMKRPDALKVYGAWILLVQVASKCPTRGVLADEDGPLTAEDIAYKTGAKEKDIALSLEVLSGQDIRWIVVAEWEHATSTIPAASSTLPIQDRTRRDGQDGQDTTKQDVTEQDGNGSTSTVDSDLSFVRRVPSVTDSVVIDNVRQITEATGELVETNDVKLVYDIARMAPAFDDRFLANTIKAVLAKEADKPFAFLHQVARGQAKDRGQDFDKIRARLPR